MTKFKKGGVVQLKSGGPLMTIFHMEEKGKKQSFGDLALDHLILFLSLVAIPQAHIKYRWSSFSPHRLSLRYFCF